MQGQGDDGEHDGMLNAMKKHKILVKMESNLEKVS